MFALAVLAIVAAVDVLVLFTLGPDPVALFWATIVTGGIIVGASTVRSLQLRSGGGEVAQAYGGTLIDADPSDPLRRRLRNVVEEMAIASGVPVPEIYVLEHEQGINAFAAGYSPADAAVAVTRGALERLDRDELQGVIAHEFSHVLNGDMRLNIRLIGFVFGILVIAVLGRKLLHSARFARDSRNAAPAVAIGLVVVVIGYIGLFFSRWIKAAVSRQREYLADASAVQFTRNPNGIGGALKKIGATKAGSFMTVDTEEVGHMLFGRGMGYQVFATHPPLEKRIRAIDPGFDPAEFEHLAREMDRHARARRAEVEEAERRRSAADAAAALDPAALVTDLSMLAERIGQPGIEQILAAATLTAAVPAELERAAHSDEWAEALVCALLLSSDDDTREDQLLSVAGALGAEAERQVSVLYAPVSAMPRSLRLSLVETAFPQLRRRPEAELVALMRLIERLARADGRVDVHEYALLRLVSSQIRDSLRPARSSAGGSKKLGGLRDEAAELMAVVARHGHGGDDEAAHAAFAAGMTEIGGEVPPMPVVNPWQERLDRALRRLDALRPASRHVLVLGLLRCCAHDGRIAAAELDLLRLVCALLHVPLPLAGAGRG